MKTSTLSLSGLLIIEPDIFEDTRGSFFESYHRDRYREVIDREFVQDNETYSKKDVLRGLHVQREPFSQGKLVRVIEGEVLDVVVDLRVGSKTFGQHETVVLSGANKKQLWIPEGFAHGFLTRSISALFAYKCTAYYNPASELTLQWNDPTLGIDWGISQPIVSDKDRDGLSFEAIKKALTS